jgi:hypothetical protein
VVQKVNKIGKSKKMAVYQKASLQFARGAYLHNGDGCVVGIVRGRHDNQQNDIQPNDIEHNATFSFNRDYAECALFSFLCQMSLCRVSLC